MAALLDGISQLKRRIQSAAVTAVVPQVTVFNFTVQSHGRMATQTQMRNFADYSLTN